MTKTQANEPGFVLAPCPFCGGPSHSTPEVGELAALVMCSQNDCCTISGATLQAAATAWNRRAAAPIVPAPADGVKALEWREAPDFVARTHTAPSILGEYSANDNGAAYFRGVLIEKPTVRTLDAAKAAAQADFERRVLSCLSSAPVEEADANASALVDKYCEGFCKDSGRPGVFDDCTGCEIARLASPASTIPSEPEVKGEAGAGPVGEAVAWEFQLAGARKSTGEYCEWGATQVSRSRPNVPLGSIRGLRPLYACSNETSKRMRERIAAQLDEEAGNTPDPEDAKVVRDCANLVRHDFSYEAVEAATDPETAHPVDEPGEVERLTREVESLTRERDGTEHRLEATLKNELAQILKTQTAEASLAETRERLEKVEAERRDRDSEIVILLANLRHMEEIAGETLEAEDAQMVSDIEAGLSSRRAALSTQESSAALAGDGKEAGR